MSDQNQSIKPSNVTPVVKPKRPVLVTIIAVLLLIGGFLSALVVLAMLVGLIFGIVKGDSNSIAFSALYLVSVAPGAVLIIFGFGLLKMKKWALYAYLILASLEVVVTLLFLISGGSLWGNSLGLTDYIISPIALATLIYLWTVRKQFN